MLFPGSTKAGGKCTAFPDTCNTPSPSGPVPIPYPNFAMLNKAKKTSTKVKFVSKAVVTLKSEIPRTMGDEAGTNKGVISGSNMDKAKFKKGSSKVKVQGQPCIMQTASSGQNGVNANAPAGLQIVASQKKVKVAL